jgi:hypothetical protein
MTRVEPALTPVGRLQLARDFRHLAADDRVALLRPVLAGSDVALTYQATLLLGTISGPQAEAALRSAPQSPLPLRLARMVSLARHGDRVSLADLGERLDGLDGDLKIAASEALARSGDPRGGQGLEAAMASRVDLERMTAAEATSAVGLPSAREVILAGLDAGTPALRHVALRAAAQSRLGRHPSVYAQLTSADPDVRALVVIAIADTVPPPPSSLRP